MGSRVARISAVAAVLVVALSGTASAQYNQTWLGGSGNWFGNPNWGSPAGSPANWQTGQTNVRAAFSGAAGTINLGGSTPATLSTASGTLNAAMRFLTGGNWKLTTGTLNARYWAMGAVSQATISLELDGIALTNPTDTTFTPYNASAVEVVLGNLANSTTPSLAATASSGTATFTMGAATNFGSIREFNPTMGFATTANVTFSGTLRPGQYTFNSNGYRFTVGTVANGGNSTARVLTITGTGGITTGTFFASAQPATTHTVWTKAGAGYLQLSTLVASGTQDFSVSAGSMIMDGTSSNLGNLTLASGATLGGTGAIGFAAGKVLTGSAGSFFTADTTSGGLDITGSLSLAQGGSGVELLLSGLLPNTGTTTLMSWTSLTSGSFAKIRYNGVEVTPGVPTPTLNNGQVAYTSTSIQFIAVPEPATVALLVGGAVVLGGREWRRRRGHSSRSR